MKCPNSAKAVSARSHEEGFGEKGSKYFGVEGNMLKEKSYTDGSGKGSVNMLLCGII